MAADLEDVLRACGMYNRELMFPVVNIVVMTPEFQRRLKQALNQQELRATTAARHAQLAVAAAAAAEDRIDTIWNHLSKSKRCDFNRNLQLLSSPSAADSFGVFTEQDMYLSRKLALKAYSEQAALEADAALAAARQLEANVTELRKQHHQILALSTRLMADLDKSSMLSQIPDLQRWALSFVKKHFQMEGLQWFQAAGAAAASKPMHLQAPLMRQLMQGSLERLASMSQSQHGLAHIADRLQQQIKLAMGALMGIN